MKTSQEELLKRIADLEERLARSEARIAYLEARPVYPVIFYPQSLPPLYPQPPLCVWYLATNASPPSVPTGLLSGIRNHMEMTARCGG